MTRTFRDKLTTCVFTTRRIIEGKSAIVIVSHDDNGEWQFLDGRSGLIESDAMVVSLGEMIDHDATILEVADLPLGGTATRTDVGSAWQIESLDGKLPEEE